MQGDNVRITGQSILLIHQHRRSALCGVIADIGGSIPTACKYGGIAFANAHSAIGRVAGENTVAAVAVDKTNGQGHHSGLIIFCQGGNALADQFFNAVNIVKELRSISSSNRSG